MKRLKSILDRFYREYDFAGRLQNDPIQFPGRYRKPRDREVAGFIASCLAYGKVGLFLPVVSKIFSAMGSSPAGFLRDFDAKKDKTGFPVKYRFNEAQDILCLLYVIHVLLRRHGSLERGFMSHYDRKNRDIGAGIKGFAEELLSIDTSAVYGRNTKPPGFLQFFPSPDKGSACKRMNLFLRWMVRDRDIDFGLWRKIDKSSLIIPLDTHIARIARCLGLTKRKAADWKTAVDITDSLKRFDPEDPLKYDFALCHQGISGLCQGTGKTGCNTCIFSPHAASVSRAKSSNSSKYPV